MGPSLFDPGVFDAGAAFLRGRDPVLARLMERCPDVRLVPDGKVSHFEALVEAIVYQQLSGGAAERIYSRLQVLFPGGRVSAEVLASLPEEALRGAGLSQMKVRYLKDLAAHALQSENRLERIHELPDDQVEEVLVGLRGIGPWSAHMFLIFRLGRTNVLPYGDLGIRKAIQRAYGLDALPTPTAVRSFGERWTPYCTIASLYLWRSLEERG
ncbi:MAG: DNA-3-methyladenine glycosylase family protein [Chthonomonadales bacterium]